MRTVLLALLCAGCAADSPPAPTSPGPFGGSASTSAPASVAFVGNDTCPTAGAQPYSPSPPGTNGPPVGEATPEMPHIHVAAPNRVTYVHNPPTSGCHYSSAQPLAPLRHGVFTAEQLPEQWVHNLEHGYVVVLYSCPTACATDVDALRTFAQSLPPDTQGQVPYAKFIAVPYSGMTTRVACVSWDWYLGLDTLDMARVRAFYDNHTGHSPEGGSAG